MMSAYKHNANESKALIDTYWQNGQRDEAFAVYFTQLPEWQNYAAKLSTALVMVEKLESTEGFKDILKWMICSK